MLLFKKTGLLTAYLQTARKTGRTIGFVPTMGALHAGHFALIAAAKPENELTVASIFVNPAQFNDKKDFDQYPATIEKDMEGLVAAGCDLLFWPTADEVYPNGYDMAAHYDLGYLETILEGQFRPGHFQGVCKVMHRLLDIVQPQTLYMGQKDYQQCMVVTRLLALLQLPVTLRVCPTLREADGLAMSSRNTRLGPAAREKAVGIFRCLQYLQKHLQPGKLAGLTGQARTLLETYDFRVDYAAVADALTLEPVTNWNGQQKIVALVAAFQVDVRLIDNMPLN